MVYEGENKDFKREGHGVEKCPEYEFEGNFHDDMKNVQGSIIINKSFNERQKNNFNIYNK